MSACLDASILVSSGVLWNASGHENVIVLVREISTHSLKNIQPIVIIYVPQQFSPETDMVCQSEQLFGIHEGQFPFSYHPKYTITAPRSWQCFRVDASHSVSYLSAFRTLRHVQFADKEMACVCRISECVLISVA